MAGLMDCLDWIAWIAGSFIMQLVVYLSDIPQQYSITHVCIVALPMHALQPVTHACIVVGMRSSNAQYSSMTYGSTCLKGSSYTYSLYLILGLSSRTRLKRLYLFTSSLIISLIYFLMSLYCPDRILFLSLEQFGIYRCMITGNGN